MAKVIYTATHRLCLPGKSGEVYRLKAGEKVEVEDGELDAHGASFVKTQKRKAKRKDVV